MPEQRRVLVVDDEKLVCESCSSILSEEGFQVETTMSARDGLRRISSESFDLLLADLRMPDIDGIELIEKVKAKVPQISIIVITGYPSVATAVRATQLGAIEYISKPFTPDELMSRVKDALANSAQALLLRQFPSTRLAARAVEAAIESVSVEEARVPDRARVTQPRSGVIVVDLNACMACLTCVVECGAAHLPDSDSNAAVDWPKLGEMMENARVRVEAVGTHCVPMRCNQCEDPPCSKVCPSGAISKPGPDKPVVIDDRLCIGCKSCMLACPFGSIYVSGKSNMLIKCDLCMGIVEPGEDPVCVRSCPAAALKFVGLEDATQETRKKAARDLVEASLKERTRPKEEER
ncbi:MAG: response regulator [Planctomycetes bacterium]|nr:response regulator [Planctomycetota bacterium]